MNIKNILLLFILLLLFSMQSVSAKCNYEFKKGLNISHWLAQHFEGKYADPFRFSSQDAKWAAENGFDHIRIPVDGRILLSTEGKLITELLEPFDLALE